MKKKSAFAQLRKKNNLSVVKNQRPELIDETDPEETSADYVTDSRHFNFDQLMNACKHFMYITIGAVEELMLEKEATKEETENFITELLNRPIKKDSPNEYDSITIGQLIDKE